MDKPVYSFGILDLANKLGRSVVGEPLSEEVGITIQMTTRGLFLYTPENGPTFLKTRQLAPESGTPTPGPSPDSGVMQVHDIIGQLPRANWQNLEVRDFSAINMLVAHWDGLAPDDKYAGYDPIQHYVSEANYHIGKDWGGGSYGHGLMYHFKIDRSGNVYQVRALQDVVWAEMGANGAGIAVCLDAGVTAAGGTVNPTDGQLSSLKRLSEWLFTERPDLPNLTAGRVWGHGDLTQYGNNTSCPGAKIKALCASLR